MRLDKIRKIILPKGSVRSDYKLERKKNNRYPDIEMSVIKFFDGSKLVYIRNDKTKPGYKDQVALSTDREVIFNQRGHIPRFLDNKIIPPKSQRQPGEPGFKALALRKLCRIILYR